MRLLHEGRPLRAAGFAPSTLAFIASIACILHATPAAAQDTPPPLPAPAASAQAPAASPLPPPAPPSSAPVSAPTMAPPIAAPPPSAAPLATTPAETLPPAAPVIAEAGSRADDLRFADAHADRVIFGSTGETHPQGTVFFSDYEVALLQVGYAFSDDIQMAISGVPPLVKDQPYFFDIGVKANVVRGRVVRAAVLASIDIVTAPGSSNGTSAWISGRFGGATTFCFEETCRSSLSLNAGTLVSNADNAVFPVYGSVGLVEKVSPLVSLLVEPALFGVVQKAPDRDEVAMTLDYGVRLSGRNFGVDLTLIKPIAATGGLGDNPIIIGYPFIAFTYRTDGDTTPHAPRAASAISPAFSSAY